MKDPVEIIAEELRVQREVGAPTDSATHAGAYLILTTLHNAGWRIVRPHPGVELDTPAIVDEWTPT